MALQSAAVASGAIFAIVLLVSIYSVRKAFGEELHIIELEEGLETAARRDEEVPS